MKASKLYLKHCFACRFDGDPFVNQDILDEYEADIIKKMVKKLEELLIPDKRLGKGTELMFNDSYNDGVRRALITIKNGADCTCDVCIKAIKNAI